MTSPKYFGKSFLVTLVSWGLMSFLSSCDCEVPANMVETDSSLIITWNNDSFDLHFESIQAKKLVGKLGINGSIPVDLPPPEPCGVDGLCWKFGSTILLNASATSDGQCYTIAWQSTLHSLTDCFSLGSAHWYGGGEVYVQHWPINVDSRPEEAFVTGDFFRGTYAGVLEPYWLNSDGFVLHVDDGLPLFTSFNGSADGRLCLATRYQFPYVTTGEQPLSLRYNVCSSPDVKSSHLNAASRFWSKPRAIPDERMMTDPVWSTWARYKTFITQNLTLQFASEIRRYGFNDSQLEIDDNWETCYGELEFSSRKFPNPAAMVSQLKAQGFRVTLWIHPFINMECPSFQTASQYVVQNEDGYPGITSWWQGSSAGYFDYSRQEAASWWSDRVRRLQTDFGFDSFKFDAGETNWLPANFSFSHLPPSRQPNGYSESYVRNMESFGPIVEVRTGWKTQDVPIFTRMLDKSTVWTYENGLKTLIPTLLQFGIEGYPFVLPDMIGGNGYNVLRPEKELFVRWMQANVFMPALQFSYAPWDYDQEVIEISLRMTALHVQYSSTIISLARQATVNGWPINRPLWWIDPLDSEALAIDSEFLLGDDLLAAPVLEPGAVSRDIYLPRGLWRDEVDPLHPIFTGPLWIRGYPAPLDTLPHFIRVSP